MVSNPPGSPINITFGGDTSGTVSGLPPTDATGDLDAFTNNPPGFGIGDPTFSISSDPTNGAASVDPDTGEWIYTVDPAFFATLDKGDVATDTFVIDVSFFVAQGVDDDLPTFFFQTDSQAISISIEGICFAAGTPILTPDGETAVEDLLPGDLVVTADRGPQPIRRVEGAVVPPDRQARSASLLPVKISAGALAPGVPARDLVVSRQHRILLDGPAASLYFGESEVLVAAMHLAELPGIELLTEPVQGLEYFHILLDQHEILTAAGAPAESLFLGDQALRALGSDSLQELAEIFPDPPGGRAGGFGTAARKILSGKEARQLVDAIL
ncbi:MAG: Hint domain-containing protein [Pseudomonadota bacterium]